MRPPHDSRLGRFSYVCWWSSGVCGCAVSWYGSAESQEGLHRGRYEDVNLLKASSIIATCEGSKYIRDKKITPSSDAL